MKNELYTSPYKDNVIAKKSKVIYSFLFDYFLTIIFSFFFFAALVNPINLSLPFNSNNMNRMNEINVELKEIVSETRIQNYDSENKKLVDAENQFKTYLTTLVKTSYYVRNLNYPKTNVKVDFNETFLNKGNKDKQGNYEYPNDNLSYFFFTFKIEESSLNDYVIDNIDYKDNKETYLYEKIMKNNEGDISSYFEKEDSSLLKDGLSKYQVLSYNEDGSGACNILMNYLVYDDRSTLSLNVYNIFKTHYYNALNEGVNQVETYYSKYIEKNNEFSLHYNSYMISLVISHLISFVLGFILNMIIIPLFMKNNMTISNKVLKIVPCRTDEMKPKWYNILIKHLILFVEFFSSIFIEIFILGQLSLVSYGFVNLLYFILFSLILTVVSFVYLFISNKNQSFSLLSSSLVYKQMDEFESKVIEKKI